MNHIKDRELICPICHKGYKRKDCYKKHVALCDILRNSMEDMQDTPTIQEIYIILQEVVQKYKECKNECVSLKSRLNMLEKKYIKKEITPCEYLLQHKKCDISYDEWYKNICINREDIIFLLDDHYTESICKIIKNRHHYNSPICAFKYKKKNLVMIYNGKYWEDFTTDRIKTLMNTLLRTILGSLHTFNIDDNKFSAIVGKLTEGSFNDNSHIEFGNRLFKHINQNISI
jgi:hypothetical protein